MTNKLKTRQEISSLLLGGLLWFAFISWFLYICEVRHFIVFGILIGLIYTALHFTLQYFKNREEFTEVSHEISHTERIIEAKKRLLEAQHILCGITYPHPNLERARNHVAKTIDALGMREARQLREQKAGERFRQKTKPDHFRAI